MASVLPHSANDANAAPVGRQRVLCQHENENGQAGARNTARAECDDQLGNLPAARPRPRRQAPCPSAREVLQHFGIIDEKEINSPGIVEEAVLTVTSSGSGRGVGGVAGHAGGLEHEDRVAAAAILLRVAVAHACTQFLEGIFCCIVWPAVSGAHHQQQLFIRYKNRRRARII